AIAFPSTAFVYLYKILPLRCEHLLHSKEVLLFHYLKLFAFYRRVFPLTNKIKVILLQSVPNFLPALSNTSIDFVIRSMFNRAVTEILILAVPSLTVGYLIG